ncbi:hypothetical protein [Mannheimia haemolytica]|uniref:Uncharacterized protein n=1 Tax=Mannheimia haemolytica TaxID=75985 RepID=A0A378PUC4_MANHA|nr:hypothetical protein [Mannheimia haemolytica]STY91739.1 Uncharacterised protein [Mannheimia haemolytica]
MKNKMGSKFIRVRVEHPQRKKEDIELVQDVVAYHILIFLNLRKVGYGGLVSMIWKLM